MDILSLFLISCALAMDAFAVSLCKGFSVKKVSLYHYIKVGSYFGLFQAIMPLIGFYIAHSFSSFVDKIDHYIAFVLLSLIGLKMIKESRQKQNQCDDSCADFSHKTMSVLALATSIDALAIGVSFAFLDGINIFFDVSLIGIITFIFCIFGLNIGNKFGYHLKDKAELIGGTVLILIGFKILIQHLFF